MEEDLIRRRFMELAENAETLGRPVYTNFLNLMELDVFRRAEKRLSFVPFSLFGGAAGCERQMIRFGQGEKSEDFPIACLLIRPSGPKFSEELSHRDFLGALMNLGFTRELLGDIVVRQNAAYVFCVLRIAPFITDTLLKVGSTAVVCERAGALPEGELYHLTPVRAQVESPRVDAVAARLCGLSRGDAQALFPEGKVFINSRLCENCAALLKPGDILSIRGVGRFLYRGEGPVSRKGRISLLIDQYV